MKYLSKHIKNIFVVLSIMLAAQAAVLALPAQAAGSCSVDSSIDGQSFFAKYCDGTSLITQIIKYTLGIAFILAVAFVIYGGILYITSAGNEERAEKGTNTLKWALIGVVVIVLSYTIVTILNNTLLTAK